MNVHASSEQLLFENKTTACLKAVAQALRRNRRAAALSLSQSLMSWEKFAPQLAATGLDAFLEWETQPLVDYLALYFENRDTMWRDLFLGERLKQFHWEADTLADMAERRRQLFSTDSAALLAVLRPHLRRPELNRLATELGEMTDLITVSVETHRAVKILFVGDYLFLDLFNFLAVPLLSLGITLRPIYATSKNPTELREILLSHKERKFDLVSCSPYSYEFNPQLAQTRAPRRIFSSRAALSRLATKAHQDTAAMLRLLGEHFDCPVFVHNTANLRRHHGSFSTWAKTILTMPARRRAATEANALLAEFLSAYNRSAARPLVLVDETALVRKHGELALSRKLYDSPPQHPAALAMRLAEVYRELVFSAANLLSRRIIVVDLDNTMWRGAIGEETVEHFSRRQQALKKLRRKGVLLAVAAKGDPENIRWEGAVLHAGDFIASEINWGHKYLGIRRIAEELGLKFKDFVFIDDRADERELVRLSIPGIQCLDATEESTWTMLDWWAAALPSQVSAPYKPDKNPRQGSTGMPVEHDELIASLGVRVELHPATERELSRAVELINHSSRFNTCGSSVSLEQMEAWHHSPGHHILIASANDKFGSMGLVSAMVIEEAGEALQIPLWVLSNRVFGFSIETSMLNYVSTLGRRQGRTLIRGLFVETEHNEPCREAYPHFGFRWENGAWELHHLEPMAEVNWLEVTTPDPPPQQSAAMAQ